jgi:DNA-binding MarR family transcriptional regulator
MMPGIADDALRQLTGYRLQRATSAAMLRYKAVFADFGLRRTTFSCLALIVARPGMKQGELGKVLAIERPNLVSIVDDLANAGLVQRETSTTDKRAYALTPTEKGTALFAEAQAAVKALDAEITKGLSAAQVTDLQAALDQLEKNATGPDR